MIHRSPSLASRTPVRTCVGCRRRVAKDELVRVTAGSDADGRPAVVPDPAGTAPGRGAHLHPTPACLDLAVRRKAFGRALRVTGGPGLSLTMLTEHLDARSGTRAGSTDQTENPPPGNWSTSS